MARWFLLFLAIAAALVAGLPQAASAAEPAAMPVGVYLDGNTFGSDPAMCRSQLRDIQGHGFDSVQWANGWPERQRQCLIEAETLGIHVTFFPADALYDGWWKTDTVPVTLDAAKDVARPIIDDLAGTGVDAIQLGDEIPSRDPMKEKFRLMVQAWHELAPQWPVMASHNVTASWWPSFQQYAKPDVWQAFNYPIRPNTAECSWIDRAISLHKSAQYNKPAGPPYYAILQAHGSDQFSLRTPTVPEMRAQFFAALGTGASGFQWFILHWTSGTDLRDTPALYNEASDLGARYRAIRANLDGLTPIANIMQSSNGTIKPFTLSANGRTFAVLLNTSCTASTRTTLSTSQAGVFTNLEDGLRGERPIIDLRPGDGAVFEFVPAKPAPSATPKPSPSPTPPAYCGYWWSRYVYPECK